MSLIHKPRRTIRPVDRYSYEKEQAKIETNEYGQPIGKDSYHSGKLGVYSHWGRRVKYSDEQSDEESTRSDDEFIADSDEDEEVAVDTDESEAEYDDSDSDTESSDNEDDESSESEEDEDEDDDEDTDADASEVEDAVREQKQEQQQEQQSEQDSETDSELELDSESEDEFDPEYVPNADQHGGEFITTMDDAWESIKAFMHKYI